MNPRIENVSEDNDTLTFTLSGVNVSLANAIRRTILSDINLVVFRTTPYEANKANIMANTTRLNNEILKQRLSCIPIHITDLEMPLHNYIMEANVENMTDTIMFVTTEDFKIKNLTTNEYLSEKDTRAIFPPNDLTGYFIDFVIETIGIYTNHEIVKKACVILIQKLNKMITIIETDELKITPSDNTLKNSYDVLLENEDYTIGKMLEYILYTKFFENLATLSYCGFKKAHPHDSDSIIRMAYKDPSDKAIVKQNLLACITDALAVYNTISEKF